MVGEEQHSGIPPNGSTQGPPRGVPIDHARAQIAAMAQANAAATANGLAHWFQSPVQIPIDETEGGQPIFVTTSPMELFYDLVQAMQETNELLSLQLREAGVLDDDDEEEEEERPAPRKKRKAKR